MNRALQQHRKLVIIDARPESEWMTSHITGAVSIPHYQLQRLEEISKDACVVAAHGAIPPPQEAQPPGLPTR